MAESSRGHSDNLPGGTVTFLFTDIEGSTQLLNSLGAAYEELLAGHHAVVRKALADWGGREIDTQGDAFFAVFTKATDAVSAVVDIQRSMDSREWPSGAQVRVRMGLHTGEPWSAGEGYVGMDVHRAARVGHAGHGGQVLLSETTTSLVRDGLPEGVSLLNLGRHRLKDMRRAEPIHQLVIEGLRAEFPPIKSLDAYRTNLPEQLTTFVGRNEEKAEIRQLLANHRLLTLVGPGGSGKTRLSLQVASDMLGTYPQGVWLVELEQVESPEYVVPAVANSLQFAIDAHSSDLDPKRQLLDYLSKQSLLMVMDNFEHLLEGASLLTDILKASPDARLMVTSRERLNLREEWTYPMSGLRYPTNGNGAGVETYSSLALFTERARQVEPHFNITTDNVQAVSRICRLVDGLPLGIELAAAWVNVLQPEEIADEIEKDIDFLATTMRDIPEKHRSLRAVFGQSWNRIPENQRAGFRRLAVFRGGFSREAAAAAAGVSLATLSQFDQKSLVRRDKLGRFNMHPLLKAFAMEKLEEYPDELEDARERHSRFFTQKLADMERRIQGDGMVELRDELRLDDGNVWSAVTWAITHWDEEEAYRAQRSFALSAQTEGFHAAMGIYKRLVEHLRQAGVSLKNDSPRRKLLLNALASQAINGITIDDPESETLISKHIPLIRELGLIYELGVALLVDGIVLIYRGKNDEAIEVLEESLYFLEQDGDPFILVAVLTWLGWAHYELGDLENAGQQFQASYDLAIEHNNVYGLPYALSKLGTWADAQQQYEKGAAYHQEALKYFKAIGDQAGQGYALSRVSLSCWGMKDYDQALAFGRAGYEQFEAIGHRWGLATTLCRLGFAELSLGRLVEAEEHFYEGLTRAQEYRYPATANYALMGLAMLQARQGQIEQAVELLTLTTESPITPFIYKSIGQRALASIEAELPPERFSTIQEEARTKELPDLADRMRKERTRK
ncbi:MAG: ATP-binding protein [Candidatus Promineifilaceae bacterium]|jgi:predicted ATPase/class 3 adenylate cyclase